MFNNIGGKIKGLAKFICWVGIIASILLGIIIIASATKSFSGYNYTDTRTIILGVITIIAGSFFSWIGSFVLYGFGELVENSSAIKNELQNRDDE